jgi:RecA/RadA recombinase
MKDAILAKIQKDYGKVIINGSAIAEREDAVIPVTPALDIALSGGIPEGSWVVVTGMPKTGKTTLCLHIARKCKLPENGARDIWFFNIEARFKKMNMDGISGLNREDIEVIESEEGGKPLSAEDFLNIAEAIMRNTTKGVFIFDSFSMLSEASEQESEANQNRRSGQAKLLAQFCRRMATVVRMNKHIVLGMTHLMANTSGWGASVVEKSGNALAYQVDVKLRIKSVKYVKEGGITDEEGKETGGKRIGQLINWVCECSALGAHGNSAETFLRYGQGFDEVREIINIGCDVGLINKPAKGAWFTCEYLLDKPKLQGMENLRAFLLEDIGRLELLQMKIRELVC